MLIRKLCFLLISVLFSAFLASCGGGSSAPPPTGGLTLTPGNGQITVTWNADPGIDYWLLCAQTTSAIDMHNPPATHTWVTPATSPYVLTGMLTGAVSTVLTNGVTYACAMDGRVGGGAGGPQTATVFAVPRLAGTSNLWVQGTALPYDLNGLTFDGTNYVAAGAQGGIYASTDGQNWTAEAASAAGSNTLSAIQYVNSTVGYVLSDTSQKIYAGTALGALTSTATVASNVNAFATDGTTVVAVGAGGLILHSTDGANWAAAASVPGVANLHAVAQYGGNWVAVGDNGAIYVSSNSGVNWAVPTGSYAPVGVSLRGVAGYGTTFVAVGDNGTVVTTTDTANWTSQTLPTASALSLTAVNMAAAQYLIVGQSGSAFTSTDAYTWAPATTNITGNLYALAGTPTLYVAVGAGGINAISK